MTESNKMSGAETILVQQATIEKMREALDLTYKFHVKPAGFKSEMAKDKKSFAEFLANIDNDELVLIEKIKQALSLTPDASALKELEQKIKDKAIADYKFESTLICGY